MAAEFLGKPFMGPPSVPHVSEEFFKVYFLGAHVSRNTSKGLESFQTFILHIIYLGDEGYQEEHAG
jgi:hypothetical protein